MITVTNPVLTAFGREGSIGVGIPTRKGGSGGTIRDVFDVVASVARRSLPATHLLAVQRHFAEVLLASQNIGLAEYRLAEILDGSISGACTATWPVQALPALRARPAHTAWRLTGELHATPNVGSAWYLVTAPVRLGADQPVSLSLLSSEQDGLYRATHKADRGDDFASISAVDVFFRGDEILETDVAQVHDRLSRFAGLMRCAIEVGRLNGLSDSLRTAAASMNQSRAQRITSHLFEGVHESNGLPSGSMLKDAIRALRLM